METSVTLAGTVHNGVVVLGGGQTLPEGASVQIVFQPTPAATSELAAGANIWSDLGRLAREVESMPCDLPEDLALNHDHYLYGTPKRP